MGAVGVADGGEPVAVGLVGVVGGLAVEVGAALELAGFGVDEAFALAHRQDALDGATEGVVAPVGGAPFGVGLGEFIALGVDAAGRGGDEGLAIRQIQGDGGWGGVVGE